MPRDTPKNELVNVSRVARLWWPLALSWLLMAVELPLITATIARLPEEKVGLAALSSLVYPLSLLVEAPIIMLLAASTTLCKDWQSYQRLWRFTHGAGLILTGIHAVMAFTPLYDWLAVDILNVHPAVVEPGRTGLQLTTPWTWAIASRRFQQGVLIRFERSRAVVEGTVVRVLAGASVLGLGLFAETLPGIAIGATALSVGVLAEAAYVSVRTRPLLRERFGPKPASGTEPEGLTWGDFYAFYVPLAVTPFMTIALQSIGAAAMNRMPEKLLSLGTWSAVYGVVFAFRSAGFAFNEVVVTLIGGRDGVAVLKRIAWAMAAGMTLLLIVLAVTPLGGWLFGDVMDLPADLTVVAIHALCFAVLMPGYAMLQSYYQGALVYRRKTRAVTEAVGLYFGVSAVLLVVGVWLGAWRGIEYALSSFTVAGVVQTVWLWYRSREVLRGIEGSR